MNFYPLQASVSLSRNGSQTMNRATRPVTVASPLPSRWQAGWLAQPAKIVVACLIVASLLLGFVVLSLGIGAAGAPELGPDRLPAPAMPAPAPAPNLGPGSALTIATSRGSSLFAGGGA